MDDLSRSRAERWHRRDARPWLHARRHAPGPCFQDYPHIGADKYGVYITTNEYDLFGPSFNAAQVFAFSKAQLAAHPSSIDVTLVENLDVDGSPGFTVWPATSPAGQYSTERNGTEYFLSTIAGDGSETGNPTGTARRIGLWALTNTKSLDSASPSLGITSRLINSQTYVFPPKADQKPGDFPLGQCINDTTTPTIFGPGCWQLLFVNEPAHDEVISTPDSLDSRMQQTWYVNGTLWGASGTAVRVNGELKAGVAWFAVEPKINGAGKVEGKLKKQGYIALANNNLTMPAIAMTTGGKGAIAFTVLGEDYHPSAGYVTIDDNGTVGPIHLAAAGLGVDDGFTSYKAFVGDPPRTRWGDYGAAVTDGSSVWIASEYIGQTCTYAQFYPSPPSPANFGTCGGTRTSLANWGTRISKLTRNPDDIRRQRRGRHRRPRRFASADRRGTASRGPHVPPLGCPYQRRIHACGEPRYRGVMRVGLVLAVASLALAAGSVGASAATSSGIRGTVVKGPTTPVCREGVPCSAPAAGVTLVFVRGGVRVASATTSKAGTFRVVLSPGPYLVRLLSKQAFGGAPPRTVRVLPSRFAVANFDIDTGIR